MGRDLTDSVVVLAGASGGLGAAIGAELVDQGAQLTLIGRSSERLLALDLAGPRVVGDLAGIKVQPPEANLSETQRNWLFDTVRQESQTGPIQGYPLVGTDFRIVGVELFGSESNEVALREAAARGTRTALANADAHLLTPIMQVEVEVPSDMVGPVLGDLQSRGGIILGMDAADSITRVQAECAMERLFGYSSDLRSQTQGRGTFTLRFSRLDRA